MVKLVRVDERLLHGQVAVTWVNEVAPTSILVANDDVAKDDVAKMALKMVKPAGVKLAIRSVDDGAALLNDPRTKDLTIFVIVRTTTDALRLVNQVDGISHINIGGIRKKDDAKLIAPAVYINDQDVAELKELDSKVEMVEFRRVPSDKLKQAKEFF